MFGAVSSMVVACGSPGSRPPPTSSTSTAAPTASSAREEERLVAGELLVNVSGNAVDIVLTQRKECRTPPSDWAPCGSVGVAGEEVTINFASRPLTVKTGFGGNTRIEFKDEDHLRTLLRPHRPPALSDDDEVRELRAILRSPLVDVMCKETSAQLDLSKLTHFEGWKRELAEREEQAREDRAFDEQQRRAEQVSQRQAAAPPPNPAVCKQRGAALY